MVTSSASRPPSSTRSLTERVRLRRPSTRAASAIVAALLAVLGCSWPWPVRGEVSPEPSPSPSPAVVQAIHGPPEPIQGPPPPGLRLPGWLPRGEVFWEQGIRYTLLDRPRVTLDGGLPDFSLTDEPVIDGRVGFRLNVDAAAFGERDGLASIPDAIEIRRAFLTTRGVFRLLYPIHYQLEFGLLRESFYLDSAWLMWRDVPWVGSVKFGGLDAPLSFDNVVSSRDRIFMEVAAPVQAFVPATSLGLMLRRTHSAGRGSLAFGLFSVGQRREVGDQSRALARVVGRTTWLARDAEAAPDSRWPELVHLGIAGAYTFAGSGQVNYQARPESFLAPTAVGTGQIDSRHAFVLGLELAGRRGPLSFQGEYLHAFVDRSTGGFPGFYLSAAYLVTGEVRPYDREPAVFGQVVPLRPLSLRARTFGAAECAARYSFVDLDDGGIRGGRMHMLGAGFNWYWNRVVRWQLGYELGLIDDGTLDGRLHIVQARFQLVL